MGTKNNPGRFDCYDKAEPDEPLFTLLGRDPMGAHFVLMWSKLRMGDTQAARVVFDHLCRRVDIEIGYPRDYNNDIEKSQEAVTCSLAMFEWQKKGTAT